MFSNSFSAFKNKAVHSRAENFFMTLTCWGFLLFEENILHFQIPRVGLKLLIGQKIADNSTLLNSNWIRHGRFILLQLRSIY